MTSATSGESHGIAGFTHLDGSGRARMVDVMGKPKTHRIAVARAAVVLSADLSELLPPRMGGAGRDHRGCPLHRHLGSHTDGEAHPALSRHRGRFRDRRGPPFVTAFRGGVDRTDHRSAQTGVEMEALTASAMTALSLVGAFQNPDPSVSVEEMTLWHKSGGRSGVWNHPDEGAEATSVVSPPTKNKYAVIGRHL